MIQQFSIMQNVTITLLMIMSFIVHNFGTTASRLEIIFILYSSGIIILILLCLIVSNWPCSMNKPTRLLNMTKQWILGLIVDSALYWFTVYPLSEFLNNHPDPVLTYRVIVTGIVVVGCIWFERYHKLCKDLHYGTSSW